LCFGYCFILPCAGPSFCLADADEQHSLRAIPPACRPRGCACHQGWCSVDRFGAGWQPRQDPAPRAQSK
jgi:hypothetical protein